MKLEIKLESFDGPLDLLLSLIEQNEIDIFDIPIAEITDQYLAYVQAMQEASMDEMSEFMLMAATLLNIKSKMLLPKEVDEETGEEIDPRAELVERLLEYKLFKYASFELRERQDNAGKQVFRDAHIPDEVSGFKEEISVDEILQGVSLSQLRTIFHEVMHRQIERKDPIRSQFGQIRKEPVSLEDRIDYIETFCETHKKFSFRNLLEQSKDKLTLIVTFLGVLELMKTGKLYARQDKIFSDIEIEVVE